MKPFTDALRSELARLNQEIAALQARREQVAALLAPMVVSPKAKAAPVKAAKKKASNKPAGKGWPKGMPRDKQKRAEWFKSDAGKAYLAANPGTTAKV